MLFFQAGKNDTLIIVVALCVLVLGLTAAIIAIVRTLKNYRYTTKAERQKMEGSDQEVSADEYLEEMEVTKDGVVLVRNVVYKVGDDGQIEEGTYLLRSAIEGETEFVVRHNSTEITVDEQATLTLKCDDTIVCVSFAMLITKQ